MLNGIWLIVKNLLMMLLVLIGIGIVAFFAINIYTRKGQTEDVPKVTGMTMERAIQILDENELEYTIVDSVYNDEFVRNTVVDQYPAPLSKVKKWRKIYLTVNSLDVPEVEMPDIAGKMSLDQAKKALSAKGLYLGEITQQPDPSVSSKADKPVFEQLYRGSPISPGTKVKRKSKIDLVVGVMENSYDSLPVPIDSTQPPPPKQDPNAGIDY